MRTVSIRAALEKRITIAEQDRYRFFKIGPTDYAHHDRFLGVRVPDLRILAKSYSDLSFQESAALLASPFNEERLLALLILMGQYHKSRSLEQKKEIFIFYQDHRSAVNNWNLVDASAAAIPGAYFLERGKDEETAIFFDNLWYSEKMWDRRIGIVSTWAFTRAHDLRWVFLGAKRLLTDPEDLMHKAVGWMLREAGKKEQKALKQFLDKEAMHMPRTMLRYAIERFDANTRSLYMKKK